MTVCQKGTMPKSSMPNDCMPKDIMPKDCMPNDFMPFYCPAGHFNAKFVIITVFKIKKESSFKCESMLCKTKMNQLLVVSCSA